MAHTRAYDKAAPANTERMGLGTTELRSTKNDHAERMDLDHYWSVETDTTNAGADGYHKKIKLKKLSTPSAKANADVIYVKDVSGDAELYVVDEDGDDVPVTDDGIVKIYSNVGEFSSFDAELSVNQVITKGVETELNFDFELNDVNGEYNTTTHAFTAAVSGTYMIMANVGVSSPDYVGYSTGHLEGPDEFGRTYWVIDAESTFELNTYLYIRKNSTNIFTKYHTRFIFDTHTDYINISAPLVLTAGDAVSIRAKSTATLNWSTITTYDVTVAAGSKFNMFRLF